MQKSADALRKDFWTKDAQNGGIIYNQYNEIKSVLKSNDMNWVEERFAELKLHAINHTAFYKNYSVDDEFPVVNKMILNDNRQTITADGGYLKPTHISSTSGSTGTPFSVVQDYKKRNRTIADLKVFGEFCDYPSHERMVFFRVLSDKIHRTPEQEDNENIYYVDSSDLSEDHLSEMLDIIVEKDPRIVFSYPSTLVELAKYAKKSGCDKLKIKSLLCAGEGISESNRQLLEKVFGCTVYRRYSDMELGILGQDMGNGGFYRLNWGSYYFECLKIDSDEPTDNGEVGRIVVTDLFNYAFPMIRYDTGDLGIMEYFDDGKFPILKEIYGRARDCIYTTSDALVSPAKIFVSMWGADNIKQWQFIQDDRCVYTLKLNCDGPIDEKRYIDKFKNLLGADAKIRIEFVKEIPVTSSNKRRAVICNYKKN